MRIAVLGNSHVGSIKRAWDRIGPERPSVELVFFAQRADGMKDLRLDGRRLVADDPALKAALAFTSRGRDAIDLDDFDALLLYSLGVEPFFLDESRGYSRQVIQRAMEDIAFGRIGFRLLEQISDVWDRPIHVAHTPLVAAHPATPKISPEQYAAGARRIDETIYRPRGARFTPQPLETIVNGRETDIRFSKGSKRLAIGDRADDKPHPDFDIEHMNDEYGALWLREFLSGLDGLGPARAVV